MTQITLDGFETLSKRIEQLRSYVETLARVIADIESNVIWRDEE